MSYEKEELNRNEEQHQFQMTVDGQTAFINYKQGGKRVFLIHTEVPEALSGKGVASALVEKTLHYLDKHHLKLVPLCSFVQSYLEKHPEWKKLLAEEEE